MTRVASRRAFLLGGAKVASLLAIGCATEEDRQPDAAGSCTSTREDIEGPYFKPSSPKRMSLLEGDVTGTPLALSGRIIDAACEPIAGAIIDFWQADSEGVYDNTGFGLRGHQVVGADGRYALTTIVPGRYLNGNQFRPAHIHCKVYVGQREWLTTQLYFEGDPYNEVDGWFSELTMLRPTQGADGLVATFDFSVLGSSDGDSGAG